jgi:hypothetical protein
MYRSRERLTSSSVGEGGHGRVDCAQAYGAASRKQRYFVIPAEAGIPFSTASHYRLHLGMHAKWGSHLRRNDLLVVIY